MKNIDNGLDNQKKEVLKAAKEIVVKFIETGRISPANFSAIFPEIYNVVLASVRGQANNITADKSTDSSHSKK